MCTNYYRQSVNDLKKKKMFMYVPIKNSRINTIVK